MGVDPFWFSVRWLGGFRSPMQVPRVGMPYVEHKSIFMESVFMISLSLLIALSEVGFREDFFCYSCL